MPADTISVFLDNEGPCTLNDNAQENMVALAKECGLGEEVGVKAFRNLSNIDDIWGDFHRIQQDPTYSSGHTLKVVLPFYKAMGATSEWLYHFAQNELRVVPNIGPVIVSLSGKYDVWKISTSYEFFLRAFCDSVGFDFNRVRCTGVTRFDETPIAPAETATLRAFMEEVAQMPVIEYNGETGEVVAEHQAHYDRLTDFIWETVYNFPVGEFLRTVHPVGQTQKREAVEKICSEIGIPREQAVYVGDSQTDVQCVQYLQGSGLSMLFNGKGRVFRQADVIYIGEDARAIEEVVDLFASDGREGVRQQFGTPKEAKHGGLLATVTPENYQDLEDRSVKKRKEFRGVHIGDLT